MSIHALQRIGDVERITETRLKLRRVSTEGVGYLPFAPIQESEKTQSTQHKLRYFKKYQHRYSIFGTRSRLVY